MELPALFHLSTCNFRIEVTYCCPLLCPLGATPFEDVQVADVGDVSMNIYNPPEAVMQIKAAFDRLVANGCIPLTMGGDHTITYPILQAVKVSLLVVVASVDGVTVAVFVFVTFLSFTIQISMHDTLVS